MTSNLTHQLADRWGQSFLAVILFLFIASASFAQDVRTFTPSAGAYVPPIYTFLGKDKETGFRVGRGRFHTALGTYTSYDSNALYSDNNPQSDLVFRLIPGADYELNTQRLSILTGYRFTLLEHIEQDVQDAKEHRANLEANYRMSRTMQAVVKDTFEKSSDPADQDLQQRVDKWVNEAEIGAKYITPGEDLEVGLMYENIYERYDTVLDELSYLNNRVSLTSKFNVSSQFRFLPKSIAFINADYGRTDFNEAGNPGDPQLSDSTGVTVNVGLTSVISRKLSATARIGTTLLYFDEGPDNETINGGIEIQYQLRHQLGFTLGYENTSQISTFTNYHQDNVVHFGAKWDFARRFSFSNQIRFTWIDYSGPNVGLNGELRSDKDLENVAALSYSILSWISSRVEYQLDMRRSNVVNSSALNSADFTRHQASLIFDFYF